MPNWTSKQRWSGLEDKVIDKIKVNNCYVSKVNDNKTIILIFTEFYVNFLNNIDIIKFFIPFMVDRNRTNHSILEINCNDGIFYLSYANYHIEYYIFMLRNFIKNRNLELMGKQKVIFNMQLEFLKSSDKFEIIKFDFLGNEDTTNSVVKLKLKNDVDIVFKEYRIVKRQRETDYLTFLNKMGYKNTPKIYGTLKLKIDHDSYELGIIMEHIKSIGDGGTLFWNNLNTYLENILNNKLDFSNIGIIENFLKSDKELLKIISNLSSIIVDFHKIMEKYDNKLECYNDNDVYVSNNFIIKIIKGIKKQVEKIEYYLSSPNLDIIIKNIFGNEIKIYELIDKKTELIGIKKVYCHQDLHFIQMLTSKKNNEYQFYLIDLEGDPQIPYELKVAKDLVFRDLASIITALFYIKFNALKILYQKIYTQKFDIDSFVALIMQSISMNNQISKENDSKFMLIILFSNIWTKFIIKNLLKNYFSKVKLKKNNLEIKYELINVGIKIYTIERAIKELNYELSYRPENAIIPILIIWWNIESNFNYL
ncbi:MAG: hypothetical protein ACTSPY_07140 [Candidatus Helarchaeota archaeon]